MTAQEIIAAAMASMQLLMKSIEAANAGNIDEAQARLIEAREHYAQASAAWDAAGQEKSPDLSTGA